MSQSLYARLARRFRPQPTALSRRDLLKGTLAASAGLLLSNCTSTDSPFRGLPGSSSARRVIVIGAGLAGLSCAYELSSVGYDVVVLDARNRVGGRVLTFHDMVPGKIVEGGGELIGTNHLAWQSYAKKFGLNVKELEEDSTLESPLVLGGRPLDSAEAERVYKEMTVAFATLKAAAAAVNVDAPWRTPHAAELDARSMADWFATLDVSHHTRQAIRAEFEANEGVPLDRQSYLGFLAMVKAGGLEKFWTDSENCRCLDGTQALATRFAEALGNRVVLRSAVVSIVVGDQVMVTTDAGKRYLADEVVLTLPPSVWGNVRITPQLPATLQPQMGTAVKYLAAMRQRFWEAEHLSSEALTDGEVAMTWDGTAGQVNGTAAAMVGFSGGPAADRLRSKLPNDRRAAVEPFLNRIYPGYLDNLQSTRFMNWPADPSTLGGYSFPAPRQITTCGRLLTSGIGHLHFAGEYTSFGFPGYMEGALQSGIAAARRLVKRHAVSTTA